MLDIATILKTVVDRWEGDAALSALIPTPRLDGSTPMSDVDTPNATLAIVGSNPDFHLDPYGGKSLDTVFIDFHINGKKHDLANLTAAHKELTRVYDNAQPIVNGQEYTSVVMKRTIVAGPFIDDGFFRLTTSYEFTVQEN